MLRNNWIVLFLFIVIIGPGGRVGVNASNTNSDVSLSVPFEPNHADSKGCGTCCSSSFTMLLRFHEPSVTFEDVFSIFGCPPFNDEYQQFMDWVNTTYTHLYAWGVCGATVEDIIAMIDAGYPVVVHQVFSKTESTGHNRVVIGYNLETNTFIINDPSNLGANYRIDFDTFEQLWFDISILEPTQPYCMWVIESRSINLRMQPIILLLLQDE